MKTLIILGIETSCDETAAAVVEDGVKVKSSVIASQIDLHAKTGGVVPEVAAREHVLKIVPVIDEALQQAGCGLADLDAIAVTQGPGLLSSLITGFTAARTLSQVLGIPLIPVNHVAGHIYSNWLDLPSINEVQYPVMTLTVSGGHNELVLLKGHLDFELIGETLDDAAGEAFDKVARLLGLGYPGGPAISKKAVDGNCEAYAFPRAMLKSGDFNFSFSGLKTAVLQSLPEQLTDKVKSDIAASFEQCVAEILTTKLVRAAQKYNVREIHLAGGVSANRRLRKVVEEMIKQNQLEATLRYNGNLQYCTDNAAMMAGVGYLYFQTGRYKNLESALPTPHLDLYED